ncbi:hypothetical protein OS493_025859 [Desmophyllum pertusum]|uniref:CUB domain-containing protein n=1 Tax=Desmophyllum pertusum TaxID=174260 RepID=A0A9X0CPL6_9CNID|nr:hypothetical protein OS493_025859 [Desmophyllum pertusum]
MWVRFRADNIRQSGHWDQTPRFYRGFKATFTALDRPTTSSWELCFPGNIYNNNLTLYGSRGTLKSPLVFYPLNSSCDWLITVPDGKIVKLSFDGYLDLPVWINNTCITDYVEILDGKQSTSKSKRRFCAKRREEPVISSGRYMWVRFRADNIRQKNHWNQLPEDYMGFKATFTALDKPKCFDGQLVTALSYDTTITSPFYPSDYYSDVDCTWRVTVDNGLSSGGYVVKVTFADFELQPYTYEHCHDGLEFYDGHNNTGSNLLGLYCGKAYPEVIYSTGQDLYVRFYTDRWLNYFKGFSVGISAVKEEEGYGICRSSNGSREVHKLSGSSGTIFTPGYPMPYPDDATCIWKISVPAGK